MGTWACRTRGPFPQYRPGAFPPEPQIQQQLELCVPFGARARGLCPEEFHFVL